MFRIFTAGATQRVKDDYDTKAVKSYVWRSHGLLAANTQRLEHGLRGPTTPMLANPPPSELNYWKTIRKQLSRQVTCTRIANFFLLTTLTLLFKCTSASLRGSRGTSTKQVGGPISSNASGIRFVAPPSSYMGNLSIRSSVDKREHGGGGRQKWTFDDILMQL